MAGGNISQLLQVVNFSGAENPCRAERLVESSHGLLVIAREINGVFGKGSMISYTQVFLLEVAELLFFNSNLNRVRLELDPTRYTDFEVAMFIIVTASACGTRCQDDSLGEQGDLTNTNNL
ncbi:hypothetical protein Anapl_00740 [Anas platyrhynchos]|uniref:Uncharacterized protein n=1 Tax=Anas platyrhynchos TaxID=8839 RepID=R0JTH8_ANAPL|nr:hypothetical protein Anapl_00740 [Anas platyrhynchos]